MPVRTSEATWRGAMRDGDGQMAFGSGAWSGPFSFLSRFEDGEETNPEELIGAAHAGCFSMSLANELDQQGYDPEEITTVAEVHLDMGDQGPEITRSHLDTTAEVPGADEAGFMDCARGAKEGCPVSRALTGVEVTLDARLAE